MLSLGLVSIQLWDYGRVIDPRAGFQNREPETGMCAYRKNRYRGGRREVPPTAMLKSGMKMDTPNWESVSVHGCAKMIAGPGDIGRCEWPRNRYAAVGWLLHPNLSTLKAR